jgi:excisionase family DNA binding protein
MTIPEQLRTIKHALTVAEMAQLLQLEEGTIRRHVRRGHIPYFKIGMTIRFDPDSIACWLENKNLLSPESIRRGSYVKRVG